MSGWWTLTVRALVALSLVGCSDDERAPPLDGCGDECSGSPPGSAPGGGLGGAGGGGGQTPEEAATISGNLSILIDDTFARAEAFTNSAVIFGPAPGNKVVSANYDGQTFQLEGVIGSSDTWLLAQPADDGPVFATVGTFDTRMGASQTLPLVSRSVIEEIESTLLLPTSPDPDFAQMVVAVLRPDATPVPGVGVTVSGAEVVAYATAGTWSEDETVTDSTGLVVVANVPASPRPGNSVEVRLSGAVDATAAVRVVRGAATFAPTVVLP